MISYKVVSTKTINKTSSRSILLGAICELITESWGRFPEEFVIKHILNTEIICLAYDNQDLIGFSAISIKHILNRKIFYLEFTSVKTGYQNRNIGTKLTYNALKRILSLNLLRPIEVMVISPNIRVIARLAKIASTIYPNPYLLDMKSKKIPEADQETWNMAKALIRISDNPDRKIDRAGLVLHDSYKDTPWLVYDEHNIPWHKDEIINTFGRDYLGYGKNEDKECIVRAKFSLRSVIKYINSLK